MNNLDIGTPGPRFNLTATNGITGTSAASVSGSYTTVSAASASSAVGRATPSRPVVTHFSGSSDIATLYTVECPAGTVKWQLYLAGTNNGFTQNWDPPLEVSSTPGATVVFKAAVAATSKTQINGSGFEVASG